MAAKSGFKNFLTKIGWDAGDEDEEVYAQAPVRRPVEEPRRAASVPAPVARPQSGGRITGTRVVNMPGIGADSVRMVVLQPQSYEDTTTIADQLKMGKPVIMNLEGLSKELGLRVLDFAIGASYALDGTIRRWGSSSSPPTAWTSLAISLPAFPAIFAGRARRPIAGGNAWISTGLAIG